MKLVYIAGAYRARHGKTVAENIAAAKAYAEQIAEGA